MEHNDVIIDEHYFFKNDKDENNLLLKPCKLINNPKLVLACSNYLNSIPTEALNHLQQFDNNYEEFHKSQKEKARIRKAEETARHKAEEEAKKNAEETVRKEIDEIKRKALEEARKNAEEIVRKEIDKIKRKALEDAKKEADLKIYTMEANGEKKEQENNISSRIISANSINLPEDIINYINKNIKEYWTGKSAVWDIYWEEKWYERYKEAAPLIRGAYGNEGWDVNMTFPPGERKEKNLGDGYFKWYYKVCFRVTKITTPFELE